MLLVNVIVAEKTDIFQIVKSVSFPEIQQLFECQELGRGGKILCPFHSENTPSFKMYDDCGHCFGCGWHGDGVDFVAKIEGLKPLEAARLIAGRFNLPVDRAPTAEEQRRFNKQRRSRNIAKLYKQLEQKAFLNMADFKSMTLTVMENEGLEIPNELVPAVHFLPLIEHFMQILISGTADERLQLLREGVLLKWAKMT